MWVGAATFIEAARGGEGEAVQLVLELARLKLREVRTSRVLLLHAHDMMRDGWNDPNEGSVLQV
jgi:hypothetical protein